MELQALLTFRVSSLPRLAKGSNLQMRGFLVACFLCILMPMEMSQLTFALVGAVTYAVLRVLIPTAGKSKSHKVTERKHHDHKDNHLCGKVSSNRHRPTFVNRDVLSTSIKASATRPEAYQLSNVPVQAPKFECVGFVAEVNELVSQLSPSDEECRGVDRLVKHVKEILRTILPELDVSGFAHGSLKRGTAFGVAVPEVDIVVSATPSMLTRSMQQRARNGHSSRQDADIRKLQKSAIRACTDQLVSVGGLKFRRSAFRVDEPRVTLLVTPILGFFPEAVAVDFSINSATPFYNAALLEESGKYDWRAKALILFVKRWAKDRGICHVAKGHLSPYMWSLLVMYFLQVRDDRSLLPPLVGFAKSSGLLQCRPAISKTKTPTCRAPGVSRDSSGDEDPNLSIGKLFEEFVHFYRRGFDWRNEKVCVRFGRRVPPDTQPPNPVVREANENQRHFAPAIEDPFNPNSNLNTLMNAISLERLHHELGRAEVLCERGASLTDLLEPWAPPVVGEAIDRSASSDKEE